MSPDKAGRAGPGARELVRTIVDQDARARARIDAIETASSLATSRPTVMNALLRTVTDSSAPVTVRRAALRALRTNSFRTSVFAPFRAQYFEALRSIAKDEDEELRVSALETLAANGDEYGQRLLMDGLRDPAVALVDAANALGMVAADVHAQDYDLVRELARSDDTETRRSALRVLAADSRSVDLFRKIARDKDEDRVARATSAVALQSLAPKTFKKVAEDVALDETDYPEIRATVLNALAHDVNVKPSARLREQLTVVYTAPAQVLAASRMVAERESEL